MMAQVGGNSVVKVRALSTLNDEAWPTSDLEIKARSLSRRQVGS